VLVVRTGVDTMRTRLLTDHERKLSERYISADADRSPTVRSIAKYAREIDLVQIREELVLIEKFNRIHKRRNGKN
jgi:hypothetical protein